MLGTYTEQVVVDYGGPLTIYGYTTKCVVILIAISTVLTLT